MEQTWFLTAIFLIQFISIQCCELFLPSCNMDHWKLQMRSKRKMKIQKEMHELCRWMHDLCVDHNWNQISIYAWNSICIWRHRVEYEGDLNRLWVKISWLHRKRKGFWCAISDPLCVTLDCLVVERSSVSYSKIEKYIERLERLVYFVHARLPHNRRIKSS